jgi:hypothetical protein
MRVLDILLEKALAAVDFKEEIRLNHLIYSLENKIPLTTNDGKKVVVPAKTSEIRYLKSLRQFYDNGGKSQEVKEYMPSTIGGIRLTSLFKAKEFGGKGGDPSNPDAPVRTSLGETTEGIKACAIYTKLITRGADNITDKQVLAVIKSLTKTVSAVQSVTVNPDTGKKSTKTSFSGTVKKQVPDVGGNIKDQIELTIALARAPIQRLGQLSSNDEDAWGVLQSVVDYVNNETDVNKYNRFFANNQKRDPINVAVRGLEGEKTDIETTYTDAAGKVRPLSHLSMSVKRASGKYDQASGLNESGNIKFFNILGLTKEEARSAMAEAKFTNELPQAKRVKAVSKLYSIAAHMLDNKLSSMSDTGEARFIDTLLANLKKSIQGDQRLVYVHFNVDGTYDKLNPTLIKNLANYVDLEARVVIKTHPYIYITDKKTGKDLFQARLAVNSDGRMTHVFELKSLLELVKEATNQINTRVTQPISQPATNPDPLPTAVPAKQKAIAKKAAPRTEPTPIDTDPNQSLNRAVPSTNPNDNIPFAT